MSENHWENPVGAPVPPVPPDCGDKDDGKGLWLWMQVQHWMQESIGTCNPCVAIDKDWVLMEEDAGGGKHTYLLVPTGRKKGIECPEIWEHPDPNYWLAAWNCVTKHMAPVAAGLGINSQYARTENQLHIHLAEFQPDAKKYLDANFAKIATTPGDWPKKILPVPGKDAKGAQQVRSYRVLFVKGLAADNLFYLLRKMIAAEQMGNQTMIVIPTQQPQPLGFYVLNSETTLDSNKGTSTCNFLLECK